MTACKNPAQGPVADAAEGYASIGSTVANGDFNYYITSTTEVRIDGLATGKNPTHINIPNTVVIDGVTYNVTAINESAFLNNTAVTTITIGEKITSIGNSAFSGCTYVTKLNWNAVKHTESFSSIPATSHQFYSLGTSGSGINVNFGNIVQRIPDYFLYYVTGTYRPKVIGSLTIPNSVTIVGYFAFSYCTGFTGTLTIPNSVAGIYDWSFANCTGFTGSLTIPDSVTILSSGAFSGCTGFNTLNLGSGLASIADSAFTNCTGLTGTLTVPSSIKSIGQHAFSGCTGFTGTVIIPASITTIAFYAFNNTNITTIRVRRFTSPNTITAIYDADGALGLPASLTKIIVPYSSGSVYKAAAGWSIVAGIIEEAPNSNDGVLKYDDCETYWEVSGLLNSGYSGAITIPATFTYGKTMDVTSIAANAFYNEFSISSVAIGSNITNIGDSAFYGCISLDDIHIPNSVTTIGTSAFRYRNNARGVVTIGTSVTRIGNSAFADCPMVTGFIWNATNFTTAFPSPNDAVHPFNNFGTNGVNITIGNTVTKIPDNFMYITSMKPIFIGSLNIPDSVTYIGNYAFYQCSSLTSLTLGTGVQTIGDYAFYYGTFSGNLNIPNSVTSIGACAFYSCSFNGTITIGTAVTSLGYLAFGDCVNVTGLTWNAVNCNGANVFSYLGTNGTGVLVNFGSTVQKIPDYFLTSNTKVFANLSIPNSVTSIGVSAFEGCRGINGTITIGTGVTSIGEKAFYDCSNVIELAWNAANYTAAFSGTAANHQFWNLGVGGFGSIVSFGNSVQRIPDYFLFFSKVSGNLNIPNSVSYIGISAFENCSGLTGNITIPNSVTFIGNSAFYGCTGFNGTITIGTAATSIGNGAFGSCTKITGLIWNVTDYTAAFPSAGDSTAPFYNLGRLGAGVTISFGSSVQRIPDYFLYVANSAYSPKVTGTLTIPNTVTTIGNHAFKHCIGFTGNLNIPNSVTAIGGSAFYSCIGLTSLDLGTGVQTIGSDAFNNCIGFTGTLTIPSSVTKVGWFFTDGTNFTTLRLTRFTSPSTITTLERFELSGVPEPDCPELGLFYNRITKIIVPYDSGAAYKVAAGWSTYSSIIEEEPANDGTLVYTDRGTYWEVTGLLDPEYANAIAIPAQFTIGGKTMNVTSIAANAFTDKVKLTGVTIGSNITSIGASAFQGCTGLVGGLTIPSSVTTIGASAFQGCGFTGTITIGTGLTSLGNLAFANCTSVTRLTWNTVNYASFLYSAATHPFLNLGTNGAGAQISFGSTVQKVPDNFLYNASAKVTGTLTIPNSVTAIGMFAFYQNTGFNALSLGTGLKTIGYASFTGCSGFTGTLTLRTALTSIGDGAFTGCSGFTGALTIPNAVTSIGVGAFYGCFGFGSLNLGTGVQTIGEGAFSGCYGLAGSLTIPNTTTSIGISAFEGCVGLNGTITIGTAVTSLGNSAFNGCTNVTGLTWNATNYTAAFTSTAANHPFYNFGTNGAGVTVSFGSTVTRIPNYFLYVDSASFKPKIIGDINIPDTVTTIGTSAFKGLSNLTGTITIGTAVTSVGNSAFSGCANVTGLTWNSINYTDIFFTGTVYDNTPHPFYNLGTSGIGVQVKFGSTVQIIPDYFLYASYATYFPRVRGGLTIPDSVTTIGTSAFDHCTGFTGTLTIGNSVTTIGNAAFFVCSGFSGVLKIPDSVTSIGNNAFQSCSSFTGTLTIGNSVATIGNRAFYGCSGFRGSLVIPESMTTIGNEAFSNCSGFTALDLGAGVTTIGEYAFSDCTGFKGTLTIPASLASTGGETFKNCRGFTTLIISEGVQTIGYSEFDGCTGFTGTLTIPSSVTSIDNYAFYNCSGFTGILNIPASVTSIGYAAIFGPKNTILRLNNFTSPSTITSLGVSVSSGNPSLNYSLQHIVVPNGSGDVYRAAEGWSHESAVDKIVEVTQTITWSNLKGVTNTNDFSIYDIDQTTTLSALPNISGWNFKQWRLNNASGAVISSIDEYTYFEPITLYAEWEATATVVSFATGTAPSDGGTISGTVASRNRYADQDFTFPTQKYTVANNNWEHIGWTTTQYGKQIQNWETLDQTDFSLGATISADDIYWGTTRTYYAVWKRLTNTLTFKPGTIIDDSGTVTIIGAQFTEIKTPSVDIDLPTTYFTATGYTQIGWTLDFVTGGAIVGRPLHNGYTLATDPQTTNTDETYYPVWKPAEYTVQYRPGKYSYGLTSIPSATKYHGASITITSTQYVNPNGYIQVGWTTTTGGGLYSNTPVTHALNSTYSGNAALTLYPVWQSGTGVVILHFTGGPNGESSDIVTVWVFDYTNPSTLTLPSYSTMNSLGRSLTFEGWYTSPDFNPSSRISDPAAQTDAYTIPWTLGDNTVIRIYAKWE